MKALVRALVVVTLGAATSTVLSVGCSSEPDPYPRPRGAPNRGGRASSGGVTPPPLDPCECAAAIGLDPQAALMGSCSTCINKTQAFSADPCAAQSQACHDDPGCDAITQCLVGCNDDPLCTAACILPLDGDTSHLLYQDVLSCACPLCEDECQYTRALTCDTIDDPPDAGADGGDAGDGGDGGP